MRIRSVLAGAVIAGVATVGTAGVAAAQGNQPTKPKPATASQRRHDKFCDTWVPRLPRLEDRRQRDERRIDELTKAIEVARDHHREDVAERLEHVRDGVQRDRDRVIALEARIHARCDR
jgi:hypothetical protein